MKHITIILTGMLFLSCSKSKEKPENSYIRIDGWDVKVKKGVTDTLRVKNWIPESELSLRFINKSDSTCLVPNLEFYPIELENYIERKLMAYLVLRATLFPPAPNTYRTEKHFVIGWNLVNYDGLECCNCKELETELKKRLNLKVKQKPKEINFTNLK